MPLSLGRALLHVPRPVSRIPLRPAHPVRPTTISPVAASAPPYPALPSRFMEPAPKRAKMSQAHKVESSFQVSGLHVTDHVFTVPLDHNGGCDRRLAAARALGVV